MHDVAKADFRKVVDQCYLCDLCYMTKCPYVPPHPWNVDFPHLMLRAKGRKFLLGETRVRDRLLTSTDRLGKLATIPIVARAVNKASQAPAARRAMEMMLGVHRERRLPPYAASRFPEMAPQTIAWPVKDGQRTPGKVAIFSTCYVDYNEPGIGLDLLLILEHNEIPYVLAERQACCDAEAGAGRRRIGAQDEGRQRSSAGRACARRLRDPHAGAVVHAHVQERVAFAVPRRGGCQSDLRSDVRPVRVSCVAQQGRSAQEGLQDAAGQDFLSCPVPLPRPENRTENARGAGMGPGHDREHGRALLGTRRNLGREDGVLRRLNADRPARVPADGGRRP